MDRGEPIFKSDFSLSFKSRQSQILRISQEKIRQSPDAQSFSNYRLNIVFKHIPEVGKSKMIPIPNYSSNVFSENTGSTAALVRLKSDSPKFSILKKNYYPQTNKQPVRLPSLNVVEENNRLRLVERLIEQARAPSAETCQETVRLKYAFSEEDLAEFINFNSARLPRAAMSDGLGSRKVQTYLERLTPSELDPLIPDFVTQMGDLICHQFGNFIPRSLITLSDKFREELTLFAIGNIFELVKNKYSVTVMRKLANHSPKFAKVAFEIFRVHLYSLLKKDNDAVLLLSTLVETSADESSLQFLVGEVEKIQNSIDSSLLLRIISSLVDRTTGPLLDRLTKKLAPHIPGLIDHQIGNYIVQSLIKKDRGELVEVMCEVCSKDPILIFSSKYRRYVVIQLLKSEASAELLETVLNLLFREPEQLCFALKSSHSSKLLLAMVVKTRWESKALLKLQSLTQDPWINNLLYSCRWFKQFLERLKWLHKGLFELVMQALEDDEEQQ